MSLRPYLILFKVLIFSPLSWFQIKPLYYGRLNHTTRRAAFFSSLLSRRVISRSFSCWQGFSTHLNHSLRGISKGGWTSCKITYRKYYLFSQMKTGKYLLSYSPEPSISNLFFLSPWSLSYFYWTNVFTSKGFLNILDLDLKNILHLLFIKAK